MLKLNCEVCLLDIDAFYNDSFNVVALNQRLLSSAIVLPQGGKILSSGRVVILRDKVCVVEEFNLITIASLSQRFKSNIAVVLKQAPVQGHNSGASENTRWYLVLVSVDPGSKQDLKSRTTYFTTMYSR
jgi:antiviral helicase SKI2